MKKLLAFLAFGLVLSTASNASTDYDRTITKIGAQGNNAYFYVSPTTSTACLYSVLYITDVSTTSGKSLYTALLSAQSSGNPLTRIDYSVGGDGKCSVSLIEF